MSYPQESSENQYDALLWALPPLAMGNRAIDLLRGSWEEVSGLTDAFISSEPCSHWTDQKNWRRWCATFSFGYVKDRKHYLGTTKPDSAISDLYYRNA